MAKTDSQLIAEANIIKNETTAGANTATRVGTMLDDIIENKINNDKIVTTLGGGSNENVPSEKAVTDAVAAKQNALGYTAENAANKENTTINTSTTKYPTVNLLKTGLDSKQDTLVSGTNIKTINGSSVLGSGDIAISGGVVGVTGFGVDNTDPLNPVVNKYEADSTVTATGTTYANAYQITKPITIVTNGTNNLSGVRLPASPLINIPYTVINGWTGGDVLLHSNSSGDAILFVNGNAPVSSIVLSKNQFYTFTFTGFYWAVNQEQVAPYKVYSALLSYNGSTTTTIQLQNTIGNGSGDGVNDIQWDFVGGFFVGTMTSGNPFTNNKTAVLPSTYWNLSNALYNLIGVRNSSTVIRYYSVKTSDGSLSTSNITNVLIEIRVYP